VVEGVLVVGMVGGEPRMALDAEWPFPEAQMLRWQW
jgi:hypothetical protein